MRDLMDPVKVAELIVAAQITIDAFDELDEITVSVPVAMRQAYTNLRKAINTLYVHVIITTDQLPK